MQTGGGVARADMAVARARAVAATVQLVARVEAAYVDVVAAQQELELRLKLMADAALAVFEAKLHRLWTEHVVFLITDVVAVFVV